MTSKELFIKTVASEQPIFERVLKAVNQKKWNYQPDPKTKKGKDIANLIATESVHLAKLIKDKKFAWVEPKAPKSVAELVKKLNLGFANIKKAMKTVDDKTWEKKEIVMKFEGGEWKDMLGNMAWGFLLDMIHHRGQLSTYLRAMGGKVPSIYGPSGDSK